MFGYGDEMDFMQWFESATMEDLDRVFAVVEDDTDYGDMPF